MKNSSTKKFFTLIELLITIAIIAVITSISLIAFSNVRQKGRDTQRLSDIKLIQKALEDYYRDEGNYPASLTPGGNLIGSSSNTVYMQNIPQNPNPRNDGNCPDNNYSYELRDTGYFIDFCLSESNIQASAGEKCATAQGILNTACFAFNCGVEQAIVTTSAGHTCNTGAPDYDTCIYDTILIGDQCWLKQNINIGTITTSDTAQTDNSILEKHCYGDNYANCQTYGGLYQWGETIQYLDGASDTTDWSPEPTGNVQGLCPTGWHVPTSDEWSILDTYIGSGNLTQPALKAQTPYWDGLDTYGFSGLPGGWLANSSYNYLYTRAYFWASSIANSTNAFARWLVNGSETFGALGYSRAYSSSVRCLRN